MDPRTVAVGIPPVSGEQRHELVRLVKKFGMGTILRAETVPPAGAQVPHDPLVDPDMPIGLLGLPVHPPGDLDRRPEIARQRCLRQPGVQFGPMAPVPIDPGRQVVGLGIVAAIVAQDEVVPEVGGVAGSRNEAVHLRQPRQGLTAVESVPALNVQQDRAIGFQAGPCLAEQERPEVGRVAEAPGVEPLDEPHPSPLDEVTEQFLEAAEAVGDPRLQGDPAPTAQVLVQELQPLLSHRLQLPERHGADHLIDLGNE